MGDPPPGLFITGKVCDVKTPKKARNRKASRFLKNTPPCISNRLNDKDNDLILFSDVSIGHAY